MKKLSIENKQNCEQIEQLNSILNYYLNYLKANNGG